MKELFRLLFVLLVQYIACWLTGWVTSVALLTLALTLIWQGIFLCVNNIVRKQKNTYGEKDVSLVMYMILSVPALFFPLLAVLIFSGLSIYRVCVIGGITVGDKPFKEQFVLGRSAHNNLDSFYEHFREREIISRDEDRQFIYTCNSSLDNSSCNIDYDVFRSRDYQCDHLVINPATGLNMMGPIDVGGNLYGMSQEIPIRNDYSMRDHM